MTGIIRITAVVLTVIHSSLLWSADDVSLQARNASEQYAIASQNCVLLDGYGCADQSEEKFLTAESQQKMLSGNFLKAWQVALSNFQNQTDQTSEQTNLKHFKIGFSEDSDHFIVLIQGLLLPRIENNEVTGITNVTLGRTTRYWISKTTFEIEKRLFYKD